jgi:pimeloyl-ACP methyl ester carboxylesterase
VTPERPSDPPVHVGWLPEGPFAYTDEGEGPALIALHGLPGSSRDFRWLGAELEGPVRLIRLEQPGFGRTPLSTEPDPTLAGRTRFVRRVADALSLSRFAVLGHSIGGPVALSVAAADPDRVSGVALLASVGLHVHRLARRVPRHPDVARLLELPLAPRLVLPAMRRGFARAGFPSSTPDGELVQSTRIFSVLSFAEIRAAAARVRCPTFVSWAEDDPLVESAVALALSRALPQGPRLAFRDGGHNIQKSKAVELAGALRGWLEA